MAAADGAAAAAAAGRPLHPPAGARRPIRFLLLEDLVELFLARLFPGFEVDRAGLFRLIRDTDVEFEEEAEDLVPLYETALKRRRRGARSDLGQRRDAGRPARLPGRRAGDAGQTTVHVFDLDGMLGIADLKAADRRRPAGPAVHALHAALPRAHPRFRRRLLRRDPRQGHRRPPPVRELRRGGAVPAPGGARPERGRDQADAVPHQPRQPDRQGADRGGRGGQDRSPRWSSCKARFDEEAQHRLGARAGSRRRAGGVRLRRAEDPRQGLAGGAARGRQRCAPTRISAPATTIRSPRASTPTCPSSPPIRR